MNRSRVSVDESMLIELVKNKPGIMNAEPGISKHKIKSDWEDVAGKLDVSVTVAQKTWDKLCQNFGNSRRKSSRLNSAQSDTMETYALIQQENSNDNSRASSVSSTPKRSKRSQCSSFQQPSTLDGALSGLRYITRGSVMSDEKSDDASVQESSRIKTRSQRSNENSRASSVCDTPKEKIKRTTSRSQLPTTVETEKKLPSTPVRTPIPTKKNSNKKKSNNNNLEVIQNLPKLDERNQVFTESFSRSRLSEPSRLIAKNIIENNTNSMVKRSPIISPNSKNRNQRRSIHSLNDPVKAFFDSMALTVSTFPDHIQAMVKMKICNVVSETEYDLSKPGVLF